MKRYRYTLALLSIFLLSYSLPLMGMTIPSRYHHRRDNYCLTLPNVKKKTLRIYGLKKIWRRGNIIRVRVINKKRFPIKRDFRHYIMLLKREKGQWRLIIHQAEP